MNTAFVAAAGKLPESGTHSPACSTRGGCRGLGKRGGKKEEEEEGGGGEQLGLGCLVVEQPSHHWQGKGGSKETEAGGGGKDASGS